MQYQLDQLKNQIIGKYKPEKIIIFGSRARADHKQDSDLDLLVIKKTELARRQRQQVLREILRETRKNIDLDILVYTPEEIKKYQNSAFLRTILKEGKILYER